MDTEGWDISLAMGVCGSGDEEVGEVGGDTGSPEVESARVILNRRIRVVVNVAGYLETNKAHNLLEILTLGYPQPSGRTTISLVLYLGYPERGINVSTKDIRTAGMILTSAEWEND